jgi:hypothetical protein
MKYLTFLLLMLSLSTSVLARAEGRKLVMGTVYRIIRNLIEVQEEGNSTAVIRVDASTSYINSSTGKPAKLKDLAVGDRIVIRVVSKDGIDTAEQVKFVPAAGNRKQVSNLE